MSKRKQQWLMVSFGVVWMAAMAGAEIESPDDAPRWRI